MRELQEHARRCEHLYLTGFRVTAKVWAETSLFRNELFMFWSNVIINFIISKKEAVISISNIIKCLETIFQILTVLEKVHEYIDISFGIRCTSLKNFWTKLPSMEI